MSVLAYFDPPDEWQVERRGARRLRLSLGSELSSFSSSALIQDLSTTGLLLVTSADLDKGDSIELSLPEVGFTTAKVVRRDGPCSFGCRFDDPIPKSAVSAAILRSSRSADDARKHADPAAELQRSLTARSRNLFNWLLRGPAKALHGLLRSRWPLMQPETLGAHAVALTPADRIVLVKLRYAEGWRLPGGGRRESEAPEAAVLRELREEIGMTGCGAMQSLGYPDSETGSGDGPPSVFVVRDVEYRPGHWS